MTDWSLFLGKKKTIFHCDSYQEALMRIRNYEVDTTTRFSVYTVTKDFGNTGNLIYFSEHKFRV